MSCKATERMIPRSAAALGLLAHEHMSGIAQASCAGRVTEQGTGHDNGERAQGWLG
jgi:hypothetical protein